MNDFISDFLPEQDKKALIIKELIESSDAYYNSGTSTLTDEEFDRLKDELRKLDPSDPWLSTVGAPVKVTLWRKARHKIPMTSLNKVNMEEEFRDWAEEIGDSHYIISDKLDGFAMDLEYKDGVLRKAITRGDGLEGENILSNVINMKNVEKNIPGFTGSLRGEVFILSEDFLTINELLKKDGKEELKNPRNGATGTAKRFDGKYSELLTLLYYDVQKEGHDFDTEEAKIDFIRGCDLPLCFHEKVDEDGAVRIFKEYEDTRRAGLNYDIDGLVIKANSMVLQKKHGQLGGNPKAQVAWKFAAVKKETTVIGVDWSLGNNQRITPVVRVIPTPIGGVTVEHASLYNVDHFIKLNLGIGDRVIISRRHDVIPALETVIEHVGEKLKMPSKCPDCGLSTMVDGKFLVCPNIDCRGLALGTLEKWVKALDIMDIGPNTLKTLFDSGKVRDPSDLYRITQAELLGLERMGNKTVSKILDNLHGKKEIPLPLFIAGLNMNDFSEKTAMLLMEAGFDTIEKMMAVMSTQELLHIKGIEEKTATQIINGLTSKSSLIDRLLSVGIKIKESPKESQVGRFSGMSFCFTGAIQKATPDGQRYTREMMEDLVRYNGGKVASVTKDLTYLVMADPNSGSSKTQKAKKYGVKILPEEEFFRMLE